jgi:hypothetical protein
MLPGPPSKFKYRVVNDRLRQIIVDSQLFFADPRRFYDQDPFDCRLDGSLIHSPDAVLRLAKDTVKKRFPHFNRKQRRKELAGGRGRIDPAMLARTEAPTIDRLLVETGVCCFTDRPDNLQAWDKHGDKLAGVCLEFVLLDSKPFLTCTPVKYQATPPRFRAAVELVCDPGGFAAKAADWCLTKCEEFKWEEEWRAIAPVGQHAFPPEALTRIVLGPLITSENEALVRSWAGASPSKPRIVKAELREDGTVSIPQS